MIPEIVYVLCGLTSCLCAGLLYRQYHATRAGLLMWSTACFVLLAAANLLLFVDLVILPDIDLAPVRHGLTLAALLILLFGLSRQQS